MAPKIPLIIEERIMDNLAKFTRSGLLNAISLTKMDIVKPTPARRLAPKIGKEADLNDESSPTEISRLISNSARRKKIVISPLFTQCFLSILKAKVENPTKNSDYPYNVLKVCL